MYRLSWFFNKIYAKEIKIDEISNLYEEDVKLAYYTEMNLSPSFSDIQPHHVLHLLLELLMACLIRP
jgi:hypothetical protein